MRAVSDPTVAIQAVTAVAAFGSAALAYLSKKHAKRGEAIGRVIEDAVNHRHRRPDPLTGEVAPRLFDIAVENRQALKDLAAWRESYTDEGEGGGLLDTGEKVRRFVENNQSDHEQLMGQLSEIRAAIDEHVRWEIRKYDALRLE